MQKQKKYWVKIYLSFSAGFFLALANVQVALGQWSTTNLKTATGDLPQATIYNIIKNILSWMLGIFGFVAVIGFVISGILYLVAAGDEDAQARAKRAMIYSITGVVVGLAGLVVIYAVDALFRGGNNAQF